MPMIFFEEGTINTDQMESQSSEQNNCFSLTVGHLDFTSHLTGEIHHSKHTLPDVSNKPQAMVTRLAADSKLANYSVRLISEVHMSVMLKYTVLAVRIGKCLVPFLL